MGMGRAGRLGAVLQCEGAVHMASLKLSPAPLSRLRLRCRSVDRSHQARTPILHGEPQLVTPRLGINVHVKHQSVLQNLLISVRIESLVYFLRAIGQHLAARRIDRRIHSHIQTLAARTILGGKSRGINQESYSDFVLYGIGGGWLDLCSESNQG